MVKRLDVYAEEHEDWCQLEYDHNDNGDFVYFEDYEKLEAERDALKDIIQEWKAECKRQRDEHDKWCDVLKAERDQLKVLANHRSDNIDALHKYNDELVEMLRKIRQGNKVEVEAIGSLLGEE